LVDSVQIRSLLTATETFAGRISERVAAALKTANIHDINSTQAILLLRLGSEETTVGNLTLSSRYIGSNVSYNVKVLCDRGYLTGRLSPTDKRVRLVKATKKGLDLVLLVTVVEGRCLDRLELYHVPVGALKDAMGTLEKANKVLG
jgi:DNA-binding MarR family transcriptional regulator